MLGLIAACGRVLSMERTSARLTKREREVHDCLAKGLTNREIAAALSISENTAKTHVSHILAKLGLATRRAAGHSLEAPTRAPLP